MKYLPYGMTSKKDKWHVFLMMRLAAFQANGDFRMKLRLAETVNGLNVEHRTSNIER